MRVHCLIVKQGNQKPNLAVYDAHQLTVMWQSEKIDIQVDDFIYRSAKDIQTEKKNNEKYSSSSRLLLITVIRNHSQDMKIPQHSGQRSMVPSLIRVLLVDGSLLLLLPIWIHSSATTPHGSKNCSRKSLHSPKRGQLTYHTLSQAHSPPSRQAPAPRSSPQSSLSHYAEPSPAQ